MRRRTMLAGLAGGLAGLAGCSGDGTDGGPGSSTGDRPPGAAPSTTATDTRTPSPTPRPGPVPAARVLGASATAADGLRVRAERWFALDSVRYAPTDTATSAGTGTAALPTVTPRRGRFVVYDFVVENTGDERLDAVRDSVFRLRVAGGTYRHVHSLGGVAFARVRRSESEPPIRPLSWYEGLDPGASVRLQLVFDAPARPAFRHYLAWDHTSPVEGVAGEVYLWPGGAGGASGSDS